MRRDSEKLSRILKEIRIKNDEMLKDMAAKLNVSSTFLSAVENGKKKVPDDFRDKICSLYELNDKMLQELNEGIIINNDEINWDLDSLFGKKKELAILLGRSFDSLDDADVDEMLQIIKKEG